MDENLGKKKLNKLGYYIGIGLAVFLLGLFRLTFLQNFSERSKASGESLASFLFVPNNIQGVANNGDVAVNLKVNLQTPKAVQFYKTVITFDKTKLQVKAGGINYLLPGSTASIALDADRNETITRINSDGKIVIMGEIQGSPQALIAGTHSMVSVIFTATSAITAGGATVNIDTTQSFIKAIKTDNMIDTVGYDTAPVVFYVNQLAPTNTPTPTNTITPTPSPTGTPSPTNTPLPNGSVALTLKLKFQGILSQPRSEYNSMEVKIKLGKPDGVAQTEYKTATFSADLSGVWTNSAPITFSNLPIGTGYKIYIKGPKHLQKKICDVNPTETASGTYRCENGRIALANGANTLDFSKVYQLVGDIPVQNGIVDSYDISLIRNNLGKTDADLLKVADLNLDGKIDSQDYSLLIAALSTRFDEGESQ